MPIYEYACTSCGERTEAKQGFDDPPLEQCEVCDGKLRKLYSPVGIVFKGSGFYSTDAKKGRDKPASEEKAKETKKEPATSDAAASASPGAPRESSSPKQAAPPAPAKEKSA